MPGGLIYFAAGTGFGEGQTFRDIRAQFGPPRLSLLPIGAYEPRSVHETLTPIASSCPMLAKPFRLPRDMLLP